VNNLGRSREHLIFYAATEWGGIYKTIDGGRHWAFLAGHKPLATWTSRSIEQHAQRVYRRPY